MLSRADLPTLASKSWNFVSTQDWQGVMVRLNSSLVAYSGAGLGGSTAVSTAVLVAIAGNADQRCTATMRFSSPTTALTSNMGVMLRCQSLQNNADTYYYYFRVHQGFAKINSSLAGTIGSSLSQAAFALLPDTDVTITASAIGSALSATFTASGLSPVTLSAVDTSITAAGYMGFRSLSQTVFCSAFTGELL